MTALGACLLFGTALVLLVQRHHAVAAPVSRACGALTLRREGVVYQVLFAGNGAVQEYRLLHSSHNPETDNDVRIALGRAYGPAGINAPPLRIVGYRKGPGDLEIPDKAVDSCGRIERFH